MQYAGVSQVPQVAHWLSCKTFGIRSMSEFESETEVLPSFLHN